MLYSKSANGFYDSEIHGDNIPADAVEITEEKHVALLEGQSQGKIISADENGYPILTDPPKPTAEQIKQAQLALVGAACAAAITGGFQSSALGKVYTYPSTQNDQANLNANVVSSLLPSLPANWTTLQICGDTNGKWDYMPHTAAQIQQVGIDGKAAIMACLTKNAQLQAQIAAATTVAAVQAINW